MVAPSLGSGSFCKDPGTCTFGEWQEVVRLTPGTEQEGSQAEEQRGDFDTAGTLVHTRGCILTVVQGKDELSV